MGLYSAMQLRVTYDLGGTAIAHNATTPAQQLVRAHDVVGDLDAGQQMRGGLRDARRRPQVPSLFH